MAEAGRVAIRGLRREANEMVKKAQKNKEISENEESLGLDRIQQVTDSWIKEIEELLKAKEKEILEF